jgi:hypothetical protein
MLACENQEEEEGKKEVEKASSKGAVFIFETAALCSRTHRARAAAKASSSDQPSAGGTGALTHAFS